MNNLDKVIYFNIVIKFSTLAWRNWLARSTVNREAEGSSPSASENNIYFFKKFWCIMVQVRDGQGLSSHFFFIGGELFVIYINLYPVPRVPRVRLVVCKRILQSQRRMICVLTKIIIRGKFRSCGFGSNFCPVEVAQRPKASVESTIHWCKQLKSFV